MDDLDEQFHELEQRDSGMLISSEDYEEVLLKYELGGVRYYCLSNPDPNRDDIWYKAA